MIGKVKKIAAQNQFGALAEDSEMRVALQAQVGVGKAGSGDDVAALVSWNTEGALRVKVNRRRLERCGVNQP